MRLSARRSPPGGCEPVSRVTGKLGLALARGGQGNMFSQDLQAQRLSSCQGDPPGRARTLFLPLRRREWLPVNKLESGPVSGLSQNHRAATKLYMISYERINVRTIFLEYFTTLVSRSRSRHRIHDRVGNYRTLGTRQKQGGSRGMVQAPCRSPALPCPPIQNLVPVTFPMPSLHLRLSKLSSYQMDSTHRAKHSV